MTKRGFFQRSPAMIGIMLALPALTGCPRRTALWIIGQEEPGRPVFAFAQSYRGDPTYLGHLHVHSCEDRDGTARTAIWFLKADGEGRQIERIVYGKVPPGFYAARYLSGERSRAVAPPLGPNCYVAFTDGAGSVRFSVAPNGSVVELPWGT